RHLKPGNVMLTASGAKLLDFGLAKLKQQAPSPNTPSPAPPNSNTTTPGMILGTMQYMAPEQLEGQEADARTDIFAFGAVVFEMLTGKKAFEGKSQASLISSIMTVAPDDRWQSARDVKLQLAWIAGGTAETRPSASTAPASRRNWLAWTAATAAMVLALAAVLITLRSTRGSDNTPSITSFERSTAAPA